MNDDRRTCICAAEKSCVDSPLTLSTVRVKESLLPLGIACGMGDDARVEAADPVDFRGGTSTFTTLISIRHEPIASAVYLQKIGAIHVDDILRESGARDTSALPMKEYSGGGES